MVSGGDENLRLNVDITAGDTSGIDAIRQLQQQNDNAAQAHRALALDVANAAQAYRNFTSSLESVSPLFGIAAQGATALSIGLTAIQTEGASTTLALANMASVGVSAFVQLGQAAGQFENQQVTLSAMLGTNQSETLQLSTAMQIAGGNVNQLAFFAMHLSTAMEDLATNKTSKASSALSELGIKATDSSGNLRSMSDVMNDVGVALSGMTNESQRLEVETAILGGRFGREVIPLLENWIRDNQQASDTLKQVGIGVDDLAAKQNAYNLEQTKLHLEWVSLATTVGPAFTFTLGTIAQGFVNLKSTIGDATNALQNFFHIASGSPTTGGGTQLLYQDANGNWVPVPQGGATAPPAGLPDIYGAKQTPNVTLGSGPGIGPILDDSQAQEQSDAANARFAEAHRNDVWDANLGKWVPKSAAGSTGGATGFGPGASLSRDLPAGNAAFASSLGGANIPDPFKWLGDSKQTIQEWDVVNKQWDQTIQIARQHELDAKVAVDELRLAGDHTSQTFLDAQAAVQGFTDAEQVLADKRAQALDQYTSQIETLRVSLENSRQVVKALVIEIQGPSTAAGRMALAQGAGVGNDIIVNQHFHLEGGVISGEGTVDWMSRQLMAVQRRGRTQLAGT